MIKVLIRRKEENGSNVEFEIQYMNPYGDNKFYGQSQIPYRKTTQYIVNDIDNDTDSNGEKYYTKDKDYIDVLVSVNSRNGKKYLQSISNNTKKDNINNLPKY